MIVKKNDLEAGNADLASLCKAERCVAVEDSGVTCMCAMSADAYNGFKAKVREISGFAPEALDRLRLEDSPWAVDGVVLLEMPAFEDFLRKVYVAREIGRGLEDVRAGRLISLEDAFKALNAKFGS